MRNRKHVEKSEGNMRDALPVKLKVGERHGHELAVFFFFFFFFFFF